MLCPLSVGRCRGRLGAYNHKAKLPGDHDRGACGLETSSCTSGAIAVPSCAFGPLCAFGPRRQGASVGRRRRSLKLAPLGRPKTTASAAQAPPAPPSGGSKRPPSPGGPPPATPARAQQHGGLRFCRAPRQPEQNSTVGFIFTERARRQPEGTIARRRALLHRTTSTARAQ